MDHDLSSRVRATLGVVAVVVGTLVTIPAVAQLRDFKGTQDPPGMKRFKGSTIHAQARSNFAEYILVVGAADWTKQGALAPTQPLEGRLIRTLYVAPKGATPLEVSRNYEDELKASGFDILFRCRNRNDPPFECGQGLVGRRLLPNNSFQKQGERAEFAGNLAKSTHYFAARTSQPAGDLWISLATWEAGDAQLNAPFFGQTVVLLDVVQTKPMDRQMVFVDADRMKSALDGAGRIALYGVLFDTDSAVIKPESDRTLAEIARLLTRNPTLKLAVVGHTDNVAPADYNLRLSLARSQAAVAALVQSYGIDAQRLRSDGKGLTQPVAPNDTEAGRAQNRRVELIKE